MSLVNSLLEIIGLKNNDEKAPTPEGVCPNCWGRDEYSGHFYDRIKQENLNVNSSESNVGWVTAYANKHLQGITLKRTGNGEEVACEKCKVSYQHAK